MNESWAIVELMGHVRIAGRLTEEERFGAKMGRLDIPTPEGDFVTQYFTGGSVYRITAVTEAVARQAAKASSDVAPVKPWDYPKPALPAHDDEDDEDDDRESPMTNHDDGSLEFMGGSSEHR